MHDLTIDAIKAIVKAIILNELDSNINAEDIHDDVSLYDDGLGLDSIAIINFIVLIEKKFEISFEESEISANLFSSINSVATYLHEKLNVRQESLEDKNG
ncbi:MAG: phosphopantetheine-binding protein [Chitinophagaceae bacterium]